MDSAEAYEQAMAFLPPRYQDQVRQNPPLALPVFEFANALAALSPEDRAPLDELLSMCDIIGISVHVANYLSRPAITSYPALVAVLYWATIGNENAARIDSTLRTARLLARVLSVRSAEHAIEFWRTTNEFLAAHD